MKLSVIIGGFSGVALATMINIALADETPDWQLALQQQLLSEKQCNLNYLTNLNIQTLGAIKNIKARAHCMNGQAYDIKSMHDTEMFQIRACGITIC